MPAGVVKAGTRARIVHDGRFVQYMAATEKGKAQVLKDAGLFLIVVVNNRPDCSEQSSLSWHRLRRVEQVLRHGHIRCWRQIW